MNAMNNFCGQCLRKGTLECAGCHNIRPIHKHLCKTFADFATPPGPNLRRIIVLPQDSKVPHFAWLKTLSSETEDPGEQVLKGSNMNFRAPHPAPFTDEGPGYELSTFNDVFSPESTSHPVPLLAGKLACAHDEFSIDHSTVAIFDKSQSRADRKLNQCLVNILSAKAKFLKGHNGKGSIAISTMTNVCRPKFTRDAECGDLMLGVHGLFDFFRYGAKTPPFGLPHAKDWDEAYTGDFETVFGGFLKHHGDGRSADEIMAVGGESALVEAINGGQGKGFEGAEDEMVAGDEEVAEDEKEVADDKVQDKVVAKDDKVVDHDKTAEGEK
ncbi:hypothetical protein PRZ48_004201 [Zasmidium cellare]|uniref:MYND-type zinc finger protein samB n=1 Tax=Zasmidium cellare TaxID=395010 RepID=A0ABR0EX68_ZASCE|nr:hypothetical protein PRZ48_004201 [Zasmidium cellare]